MSDSLEKDSSRATQLAAKSFTRRTLLQGAADRDLDEQRRLEREAQVRRFRALAAAFAG